MEQILKNELIKMPVIEERNVTMSGASFAITLPQEWVKENNIKAGDKILVKANGHIEIRVKNEDNLRLMNEEILFLRNQLSHITRSDDDQKGEKRQAQVGLKNNNSRG
jgi:antitoxin component of MazEF toxin-antitoxin module